MKVKRITSKKLCPVTAITMTSSVTRAQYGDNSIVDLTEVG